MALGGERGEAGREPTPARPTALRTKLLRWLDNIPSVPVMLAASLAPKKVVEMGRCSESPIHK